MLHCQQRRLARVVVPPQVLRKDLVALQSKLKDQGWKLDIPIERISDYYSAQISDCSFDDRLILITLQVPIIRSLNSWKIFELVSAPFSFDLSKFHLCHAISCNK